MLKFPGAKYVRPGVVSLARYHNMRVALLVTTHGGASTGKLSINLPDEPLAADELAIKTYSENEGVLPALVEAGLVSRPHRHVVSGHVEVPICRMLQPLLDEMKRLGWRS
jgi:hypothetical protein